MKQEYIHPQTMIHEFGLHDLILQSVSVQGVLSDKSCDAPGRIYNPVPSLKDL